MVRMSEQTIEEFKKAVMEMAINGYESDVSFNKEGALERALDYVFRQAHLRGGYAARNNIIE
ncbi:hypothetical protein ACHHV8_36540 [Paenibacillus sp. TAB 01]|uniref:hypothetical protein n=1 Tax=Paenibacillus sp. TAB 01 TaxID=3368988 RepID=UPI0037534F9D